MLMSKNVNNDVSKDSPIYVLSVTVLTLWVAPPEMFYGWYRI